MFNCRTIGPKLSVLLVDYSVTCYTPTHYDFQVVAAVVALTFVLGVPLWTLWQRTRPARSLHPDAKAGLAARDFEAACTDLAERLSVDTVVARDIVLEAVRFNKSNSTAQTSAYKGNCVYWGPLGMLRKTALVGVSVFLGPGTMPQFFFMGVVACLFCGLHIRAYPFRMKDENLQQACEEIAIVIMIFVTAFLRVAEDEKQDTSLYYFSLHTALVVLVLTPLLFSLVIKFWRALLRKRFAESGTLPSKTSVLMRYAASSELHERAQRGAIGRLQGFSVLFGPDELKGDYHHDEADGTEGDKRRFTNATGATMHFDCTAGKWRLKTNTNTGAQFDYSSRDNADRDVPWSTEDIINGWKWRSDPGLRHDEGRIDLGIQLQNGGQITATKLGEWPS